VERSSSLPLLRSEKHSLQEMSQARILARGKKCDARLARRRRVPVNGGERGCVDVFAETRHNVVEIPSIEYGCYPAFCKSAIQHDEKI
jgi:hypothetical protein